MQEPEPQPLGREGTSRTLGGHSRGVREDSTQGSMGQGEAAVSPSSFWASQPCFSEGKGEL